MSEPTILIVGPPSREERRRGRPSIYGERAERRLEVRVTDDQIEALKGLAQAENRDVSSVVRDAVNEYVADYGERSVFTKARPYQPE